MKNLFIILISLISINSFSQLVEDRNQDESIFNQLDGPIIDFKTTIIDYGEVKVGEDDGKRVFKFVNKGNEPLKIFKAYSTCGCTVPIIPEGEIAPGEESEIIVKYDVSNKRIGPIRKTITVYSNATNSEKGISSIKIKGTVLKGS